MQNKIQLQNFGENYGVKLSLTNRLPITFASYASLADLLTMSCSASFSSSSGQKKLY